MTSNLTYAGQKKGTMFGPQHTSLIYETLLPNEIRFVRRTIVDDSTFTIVLQKANLGDAPDFDALSYAWGDREQSTPVGAAGGPTSVEIAPNLRSAMNHFWSSSLERAIWIDALCIYQDRHRTKYCRNLRFEPLFREGVGSAHLASLSSIHTHTHE